MNGVVDTMTSVDSSRAELFQAMHMQAQRKKQYQEGRLALAERMASMRENEAALVQQDNNADLQRKASKRNMARMLQLASANVSVAHMLSMQREWIAGGCKELAGLSGGGSAAGGGDLAEDEGTA